MSVIPIRTEAEKMVERGLMRWTNPSRRPKINSVPELLRLGLLEWTPAGREAEEHALGVKRPEKNG